MPTKKNNSQLFDQTDLMILSMLSMDADVSVQKISQQCHLSVGSVHNRIKRLTAENVIEGTRTKINLASIGFRLTAFIGITIKGAEIHDFVIDRLKKIPEVIRVFTLTGPYNMMAEVVCTNTDHLRELLTEQIQVISGVLRTESMLALNEEFTRSFHISTIAVK